MSVNEKYPDTSTSRGQRMAIWIICLVMAGGTMLALFLPMIFANNPDADPNKISYNKALEEYEKQQQEQDRMMEEAAGAQVVFGDWEKTTFDADSVTELDVKVLREGTGELVTPASEIGAYYTGWTPDGTIFDSTKRADLENEVRNFSLTGVISGWTEGLSGQRVGGVYQLTIPSEMAYGEAGSGSKIPPNTPLRFIVEIVEISK